MKHRKLVVTGGLGFIGSNLVENLCVENEVTVIDDQSTGSLKNVKHLNQDNLNIINCSIIDPDLASIFKDHDYVFHHAALPSVIGSINDPQASNEVNISGTLNVLVAARDVGIKKLIFATSAAVYGDSPTLPKSEDMPVDPLSPYAIAKVTGEFYCKVFQDLYGLNTTSLRYFNVFGPRQDPNSQYAAVIPKFINAILNDEPPVIFGDGEQSRDFIYVKHVVDAKKTASGSLFANTIKNDAEKVSLGYATTKGISGNGPISIVMFKIVGENGDKTPLTISVTTLTDTDAKSMKEPKITNSEFIVGSDIPIEKPEKEAPTQKVDMLESQNTPSGDDIKNGQNTPGFEMIMAIAIVSSIYLLKKYGR